MYGTGGTAAHTAMALRFDRELYVIECVHEGFWPKNGVQRNKWDDWIKMAQQSDYNVSWLPLKKDMRDKFDEEKAIDFFYETDGLPYGLQNVLFSFIDTAEDNWPPLMPKGLLMLIAQLFEIKKPDSGALFFDQALNHRM